MIKGLQWRHNRQDDVSKYRPHDCLLNRLFKRRSKKASKLRATGLCAGNSPGTGEFPAQRASNAENVSIWWRHHGLRQKRYVLTKQLPGLYPVQELYRKLRFSSFCTFYAAVELYDNSIVFMGLRMGRKRLENHTRKCKMYYRFLFLNPSEGMQSDLYYRNLILFPPPSVYCDSKASIILKLMSKIGIGFLCPYQSMTAGVIYLTRTVSCFVSFSVVTVSNFCYFYISLYNHIYICILHIYIYI